MTLAGMVAGLTVQAADTTLTLACKGNETSGGPRKSSEVINIGIIVDLQKKTVAGLEPTAPLTITEITETTISFFGAEGEWHMSGTLDRVTGSLTAFSSRKKPEHRVFVGPAMQANTTDVLIAVTRSSPPSWHRR